MYHGASQTINPQRTSTVNGCLALGFSDGPQVKSQPENIQQQKIPESHLHFLYQGSTNHNQKTI